MKGNERLGVWRRTADFFVLRLGIVSPSKKTRVILYRVFFSTLRIYINLAKCPHVPSPPPMSLYESRGWTPEELAACRILTSMRNTASSPGHVAMSQPPKLLTHSKDDAETNGDSQLSVTSSTKTTETIYTLSSVSR